jgi:hypothetical protein
MMFIPDPNFFHLGTRIHIKEFKFFNPKKCFFLKLSKYDPGCSSRIPDPDFLPIPDLEIKKAPDPETLKNQPSLLISTSLLT